MPVPSNRLQHVYDDPRWPPARQAALERAGYQCEAITPVFGERCTATTDLTVDHQDEWADVLDDRAFDPEYLKVFCRHHHGVKDGGRSKRRRDTWE